MSDPVVIALLTLVGTGAGAAHLRLLKRISALEKSERALWWWARLIADMYYRHRVDGSPDLPPPPTNDKEQPE